MFLRRIEPCNTSAHQHGSAVHQHIKIASLTGRAIYQFIGFVLLLERIVPMPIGFMLLLGRMTYRYIKRNVSCYALVTELLLSDAHSSLDCVTSVALYA